jgi:hypothetical protein
MNQDPKPAGAIVDVSALEALLDLSFTKFVTIRIVKLLYLLTLALFGIGWLVGVVTVAGQFGLFSFAGFLAVIGLSVMVVVEAIFARVGLELVVVLFRIGENTAAIAGTKT